MNGLTPAYLKSPLRPPREQLFGYRSINPLGTIPCRTDRHQKTFYPDTLISWNNIGPELRDAKSLSVFKKNILKIIRPKKKDIFNIHNPFGIKRIFQYTISLFPLPSCKWGKNKWRWYEKYKKL